MLMKLKCIRSYTFISFSSFFFAFSPSFLSLPFSFFAFIHSFCLFIYLVDVFFCFSFLFCVCVRCVCLCRWFQTLFFITRLQKQWREVNVNERNEKKRRK
ncbi:hypothetical protein, unlikely [Trypanosoma brucei gambiense DAL972]|uniref:Uncharacterized protein n=1 Tax=Trypanosoma brucei gambiense (strain MHOM/CI/86/DAL972) TaxID=679716 RepID=D0A7H6_TRYB9|nr:hypothetical protein, unlikely [Trypanosoma brucei gambiense DAL972]CBH17627.1 hypothetical protein, unlikely [Trypanosoma brucei gambiense DAL972]|eukprot:XP_011779891.1 hypothetical protein, unlikely [Trypanosoma brucei gambiense DAL972]